MNENPERPKTPIESLSTSAEKKETSLEIQDPTGSDEALHRLHAEATRARVAKEAPSKANLDVLHSKTEHCASFPLLTKYVDGELPSIERMFFGIKEKAEAAKARVAEDIQNHGEDAESKKTLESLNLLIGRERQIHESIKRYVHSVIRFEELRRLSAGGTRDLTEQFVDSDNSRRKAHNNLLDSLALYNNLISKLTNEGILGQDTVTSWSMGQDARMNDPNRAVVFSNSVLANRDFVRQWAQVVDFAELFQELNDLDWLKPENRKDRS